MKKISHSPRDYALATEGHDGNLCLIMSATHSDLDSDLDSDRGLRGEALAELEDIAYVISPEQAAAAKGLGLSIDDYASSEDFDPRQSGHLSDIIADGESRYVHWEGSEGKLELVSLCDLERMISAKMQEQE